MSGADERNRGRFRVLVGGIGYRFLRDGSIGPWVSDQLSEHAGGSDGIEMEVEDLSYHPVGLHQNLTERPPYDRVVLVGAVNRGREPATIHAYRWDGELPSPGEVQERMSEAVTGVISLPNLLIVCGALGGLPDDVRVVEVEPADEGWGEGFSPQVEAVLDELLETVWTSTRP
jgi:hydrogenase maturation protease